MTEQDLIETLDYRIEAALAIIQCYGCEAGAEHKQWVLDQVVRQLVTGEEDYKKWVAGAKSGIDGPDTFDWDEGVAP